MAELEGFFKASSKTRPAMNYDEKNRDPSMGEEKN